ncbi:MAG: DUF5667 domain-containing protein [Candidatus Binatia bacterium]
MTPRRAATGALLLLVILQAAPAAAGHGMVTSFAAIEWLPEPGRTPDESFYFLDGWKEARELAAASSSKETVEVSLRVAREKLAELEAMVRAGNDRAAEIAADRYRALVAGALGALRPEAGAPPEESATAELARTFCQALLEHRYILSVDYETLPEGSRGLLVSVAEHADAAYRKAAPHLAQGDRDPFSFKDNEVRWSVRAGMQPN